MNIKPCPFCGETDEDVLSPVWRHHGSVVECGNCGTEGPMARCGAALDTEDRAIERWNQRASQSVPPEGEGV